MRKENYDDFLNIDNDEVVQKGIVILNDIREIPIKDVPYMSTHYIISINHSGNLSVEYEGQKKNFTTHCLAIIYPHHSFFIRNASEDYHTTRVIVSQRFFERLSIISTHGSRFRHEQQPQFVLSPSQYNDIITLIEALCIVTRHGPEPNEDMTSVQLQILVEIINKFRSENEGKTSNGHVSSQLYDAIIKYYKRHRSVEFYASLFCLSPKYFSTAVKQETGHNASYWIQQHVILMAKTMLHTKKQLPLQEISENLGFPDIATFSRYFKRATGISPSRYRHENP